MHNFKANVLDFPAIKNNNITRVFVPAIDLCFHCYCIGSLDSSKSVQCSEINVKSYSLQGKRGFHSNMGPDPIALSQTGMAINLLQ